MQIETLIADLGALLGMPSLSLSSAGSCELVFDGHLSVTIAFQPQAHKAVLASVVERSGTMLDARRLEILLRGNHLWTATRGATLSLSEDRQVWLLRELPADGLTAQQLLNAVEQHVNTLEQWTRQLQTAESVAMPREVFQAMQRV